MGAPNGDVAYIIVTIPSLIYVFAEFENVNYCKL